MCKLHRCALCKELFPKGQLVADHVDPVVCPEQGFVNWDTYIARMFCEAEGFQAVCVPCHDAKTSRERAIRDGGLKKVSAPRPRRHKG
jgi:5-methylcytosine-specific restriction endonuclease McrA